MSDKKFDLNKFLQQPKLFTPIDYSGIVVPDLSGVQQTVDNLDEWRKSQGYKTNEEKLKEAQEKASAAMAALGNSEDVYDWYNAFQDDPRKQTKFREDGAKTAGLLMTVPLTVASAGTMGWIPALTSTATGFAGAYGGQKLGEAIDTKYGTNTTPWLTLAGGLVGGYAGARNTPMMSRTMLHQAKNMNWTQEGVVIPTKAPKWKWARSKNAHYDNGTIKTPFFARKSQVAHELGHYVGDYGVTNPGAVRGAFTRGYQYSPNAEMELNAAENFADYFKTKLGYPYTGKDANLVSRQNALNNETVFDDVARPDSRVYESKLTEAERLGIPKGERNQPYNPTATERIYSVLGRDPNVPTEGVRDFTTSRFAENQLQSLYKFLQQHGADTKNITLSDLENLYGKRLNAIKSASHNDYNLAVPQGTEALPRQWEIRAFDPEGLVGEMMITGPMRKHPDMLPEIWEKYQRSRPGSSVDMVRNATRADGTSMYHPKYGWYAAEVPTRTPVSGVSQRMYDAGVPVAQQTNNGRGLMSGEMYLQPQRSIAVMEHYPTKQIIRNNGEWHWENLDPTKVTTRDNPVYLLTQPSGRYKHIPTKSSLFFPSVIKDGQITTNINHGSIFLEEGGKINPQQ